MVCSVMLSLFCNSQLYFQSLLFSKIVLLCVCFIDQLCYVSLFCNSQLSFQSLRFSKIVLLCNFLFNHCCFLKLYYCVSVVVFCHRSCEY